MASSPDFADAPLYRLLGAEGALSDPFRARRVDGGMALPDGRRLDGKAFAASALRCDESGNPIIPVAAGLSVQALALRRADAVGVEGVGEHLDDLSTLREGAAIPEGDVEARADAHLHDVYRSGLRDHVVSQRDLEQAAAERAADTPGRGASERFVMHAVDVETTDMVLARIQKDTGISPHLWNDVKDYPTYMIEAIRRSARDMLAPILGNAVALEDLRRLEISKTEVERLNAVRRWAAGSGTCRTLPPFSHPSMPGYVTSEATLADVNGVAMLIFSDFRAGYVYAWQSDPDVSPVVDAEEGDDGVPSWMRR